MAVRSQRGPLLAGIILIFIGLIFLMENWYGHLSFWRLFVRYWPVILILIGLRKLYGYFTYEEIPPVSESEKKE